LIAVEVAHDMDEDDYRFEASVSGSGKEADAFYLTAKRALADKLRPKFQQFPKDMIATHGKDLIADAEAASSAENSGANTPSSSSTPAPSSSTKTTSSSTKSSSSSKPASSSISTAIVRATGEFQADAATLWDFLTSADKLPMWTRNPAKMSPEVGSEMELFGGNIRGKVQTVEAPKKIVTSWRAPTWPEGEFSLSPSSELIERWIRELVLRRSLRYPRNDS